MVEAPLFEQVPLGSGAVLELPGCPDAMERGMNLGDAVVSLGSALAAPLEKEGYCQ